MSAYRKEHGLITDQDVQESDLKKHVDVGRTIHPATINLFRGFTVSYVSDGFFCREWHLYSGYVLLFITYTCDADQQGVEDHDVEYMLNMLTPTERETS